MKLRDLANGDGTGRKFIEVNGGLEIVVDKWIPRGFLLVFDDVAIVNSLDDDIERITRYPFALKLLTFEKLGLTVIPPATVTP